MKQNQPQKIIWPNNTEFFLTTSTFLHYPFFREAQQKMIVLKAIYQIQKFFKVTVHDYSIAMNHFHLTFFLEEGSLMTKIKTILHSSISREYRRKYSVSFDKFWHSTRTLFIKDEEMYWKVTGYIIGNLLKHREASTFNHLRANPFCTFERVVEILGEEMARNLVHNVINIPEDLRGEVKLDALQGINIKDSLPFIQNLSAMDRHAVAMPALGMGQRRTSTERR